MTLGLALLGMFLEKCTSIAEAASLLLFAMLVTPGQDKNSAGMLPTGICIGLIGPIGIIRTGFADPVTVTFRMKQFM